MSDQHDDRLRTGILACLAGLAKVLGMLPIPIEVTIDGDSADELEDMLRARKLLHEIPMHDALRAACNTAILDWMTALTLGTLADQLEEDDEDRVWMVTAGVLQTHRCRDAIDFAIQVISGDIVIEE